MRKAIHFYSDFVKPAPHIQFVMLRAMILFPKSDGSRDNYLGLPSKAF